MASLLASKSVAGCKISRPSGNGSRKSLTHQLPIPGVLAAKPARQVAAYVAAPIKESWQVTIHDPVEKSTRAGLPALISRETLSALEAELDNGAAVAALRRFNVNLMRIPADRWQEVLKPMFNELCFNLESFNPAFTACLLMVQRTIGQSDYVRRDMCLKNLIQPLAGEYGMHNNQPQLKTHRELFSDFFTSLFGYPLDDLIAEGVQPVAAQLLFDQMMQDILSGGNNATATEKASYALGYNLAIEYLADYEKTWMLDTFRELDRRIFSGLGKKVDWVFLEVHAEGEAEHAAIGHSAVLNIIPAAHEAIARKAMADHERDFAAFYNKLADMLEC